MKYLYLPGLIAHVNLCVLHFVLFSLYYTLISLNESLKEGYAHMEFQYNLVNYFNYYVELECLKIGDRILQYYISYKLFLNHAYFILQQRLAVTQPLEVLFECFSHDC